MPSKRYARGGRGRGFRGRPSYGMLAREARDVISLTDDLPRLQRNIYRVYKPHGDNALITLAVLAGGGYLLGKYLRRRAGEVVSNVAESVANVGQAVGGVLMKTPSMFLPVLVGQTAAKALLGWAFSFLPKPVRLPEEIAIWEVPYLTAQGKLRNPWQLMRTGFKRWPTKLPPSVDDVGAPRAILGGARPVSHRTAGNGTLERVAGTPYRIFYHGSGKAVESQKLSGDLRALYVLDKLCEVGGVKELHHLGMFNGDRKHEKDAHLGGHAIDIVSDATMNALISGAYKIGCPIAWVSRHSVAGPNGTRVWPMFFIDPTRPSSEAKRQFSTTTQNHNSHYCLMLPRPQFAIAYYNKWRNA